MPTTPSTINYYIAADGTLRDGAQGAIAQTPRIYYGTEYSVTLTFPASTIAEGDQLQVAVNRSRTFFSSASATGDAPVAAVAKHEVTAEEATAQAVTLTLSTNTRAMIDQVNGIDHPVRGFFGVHLLRGQSFISLAVADAFMMSVESGPDAISPSLPVVDYPTREEAEALTDRSEAAAERAEQAAAGIVPPLQLDAPPTTSTVGSVGQLATWHDLNAADQSKADHEYHLLYIVESAGGKEYIWREDVTENQGNVAGGYPILGSDGKIASAQLPPMDYIPASEKGGANGVAPLNGNGAVVAAGASFSQHVNLDYGKSLGIGWSILNYGYSSIVFREGKALNWYGIAGTRCVASTRAIAFGLAVESGQNGAAFGKFSTTYTADNCAFKFGGGTEGHRRNIEELSWNGDLYIAGGHQQGITVIPAATTAYTLAEGVQNHAPEAASVYTLPTVTDATRTHECILSIKFSASVLTYEFQDSAGTTLVPLPLNGDIEAGSVVTFLCRYNPLLAQWVIYPVMDGKEAQE